MALQPCLVLLLFPLPLDAFVLTDYFFPSVPSPEGWARQLFHRGCCQPSPRGLPWLEMASGCGPTPWGSKLLLGCNEWIIF